MREHKVFESQRQMVQMCIVCLTMCLSACVGHHASNESDTIRSLALDSIRIRHDITSDAILWADSVVDSMTLEEMAGQLIMPAVFSDVSQASMRILREYAVDEHVGGVVLLKGSVPAVRAIADTLRNMLRVPPFIAIDAEWGLAMRLSGTPEFPRNGRIST